MVAKRGVTKQSEAANLIGRLRDCDDDVWRFMEQPDVLLTNNTAEQVIRMPKVKQKDSDCFGTTQGADTLCTTVPIWQRCSSKEQDSLIPSSTPFAAHHLNPTWAESFKCAHRGDE